MPYWSQRYGRVGGGKTGVEQQKGEDAVWRKRKSSHERGQETKDREINVSRGEKERGAEVSKTDLTKKGRGRVHLDRAALSKTNPSSYRAISYKP